MNGPRNQARISTDKFGQAYQVVAFCKDKKEVAMVLAV
jgi:hypothetical protein